MLLPAARTHADNENDEDAEEYDAPNEAISDCEQGRSSFHPRLHSFAYSFSSDQRIPTFNRRGISGKGDALVTKHNATICGKRNVARVMNTFPPEFDTGNVMNETRLSNRVYNQLKLHSYAEEKRMNRLHDKVEKATASLAFDPKTRIILYKSLNACILNEIGSIIATGKESIVLYGKGGQNEQHPMPEEVAIKVRRERKK